MQNIALSHAAHETIGHLKQITAFLDLALLTSCFHIASDLNPGFPTEILSEGTRQSKKVFIAFGPVVMLRKVLFSKKVFTDFETVILPRIVYFLNKVFVWCE